MHKIYGLILVFLFFAGCSLPYLDLGLGGDSDSDGDGVSQVGGDPSAGASAIYHSADLSDLCVDHDECLPSYSELSSDFINITHQEPLSEDICNFDYNPNAVSTFVLNRVNGNVNGLELLLSKQDLFFIAWVSLRMKINPYFLLGVLSQESAGNCAAVSSAHGEGCFQITNTFGRAQLDDSYPDRVQDWNWSSRSSTYYPDSLFEDPTDYFGETPGSDQFRLTTDPTADEIDSEDVSSIVNFPFGAIASGLYFKWQEYLLYHSYTELSDTASDLFQTDDGKASWQAAAYNGGAYGATNALETAGSDFLDEMSSETQDYAAAVVDYCKSYQAGSLNYSANYSEADIDSLIDLLSYTYPDDADIDWDDVKDDVHQVFFDDGTDVLTFVDDIKAVIYVISTHVPELAPEWPEESSI